MPIMIQQKKNICNENTVYGSCTNNLLTNETSYGLINEKEQELLSLCRKLGIAFEFSSEGKPKHEQDKRIRRMKSKIKTQQLKCQIIDIPDALPASSAPPPELQAMMF